MSGGVALVVTMTTTGEGLDRFCHRLSAVIQPSQAYLASVIATGTQIYPVRLDAIGMKPTLLECEFRPREQGGCMTREMALDVLARLSLFEVTDAVIVDEHRTIPVLQSSIRVAG